MNTEVFKYSYLPGQVLRVIRTVQSRATNQAVANYLATQPLNLLDVGMRQVVEAQATTPIVTFDTIIDQLVREGLLREIAPQDVDQAQLTVVNLLTNDAQELHAHLAEYTQVGRHVEFAMYLDHALGQMLDNPHILLNRTLPIGYVIASKDPVEGFVSTSRDDYLHSTVMFRVTCMFQGRPEVVTDLRPLHIYRYSAGVHPTYDPVDHHDAGILSDWLGGQLNSLFSANHVHLMVGRIDAEVYTSTNATTQATMRFKLGMEEGTLGYKLMACLEPRHQREPLYHSMREALTSQLAMTA